jgi:hypothetical protein
MCNDTLVHFFLLDDPGGGNRKGLKFDIMPHIALSNTGAIKEGSRPEQLPPGKELRPMGGD